MRIGIVNQETWGFLEEIQDHLRARHAVSAYRRPRVSLPFLKERAGRLLLRRSLSDFMAAQDVVFFEWASELLALASRLPKRAPIVARLHRYEMYEWADRIDWDGVDAVIVVSEAKKREFCERFPAQERKVAVVEGAVSLRKFTPSTRPFQGDVGLLAHLTPRKRVYELILAFARFSARNADARLHIAGGAHPAHRDYYRALRRLPAELGVEHRVAFYDHVDDTASWYSNIDVFVSNSYSEGLQVAPMEALACGKYCLSHRWEGAQELLPESCLFWDDAELLERLEDYWSLPPERKAEVASEMRALAEKRFDSDRMSREVESVLGAACRGESPIAFRVAAPVPELPR